MSRPRFATMIPCLLALLALAACGSEADPSDPPPKKGEPLVLEGTFVSTPQPSVSRGDLKVSLFPSTSDGLHPVGETMADGYLFRMVPEGSYTTTYSGTAGHLSGRFNITIPASYTEPTLLVVWADQAPIGTFDLKVARADCDWNSLVRLANGDEIGAVWFDETAGAWSYQTWVEDDPVDGPHLATRTLASNKLTDVGLANPWTAPW